MKNETEKNEILKELKELSDIIDARFGATGKIENKLFVDMEELNVVMVTDYRISRIEKITGMKLTSVMAIRRQESVGMHLQFD